MKKLLLSVSLGLLVAGGVQAQTLFTENFNATTGTALPTGWTFTPPGTTSWQSGTAQSLSSQSFGFPENDGRLVAINDDGAGQSANNNDALLASKSYDLSGQTGVYLSVDMFYMDGSYNGKQESLTIEVSDDGGATWTVVQTVDANVQYYWETRYVDLSAYSGMNNVKVGFRYSDDNGGWLFGVALDNFKLYVPYPSEMALLNVSPVEGSVSAYGLAGSTVTISGTVKNNGLSPVSSYTINYQQGANPVVSTPETANPPLAMGEMATFDNITYTIPAVGDYPIKVWVTVPSDGDNTNDSADAYVQGVSTMPAKKLVFEEATGTWCGWCPRGSVGMEEFADNNPGVAAQIAVHNGDPMTVSAYDNTITNVPGFSGFPSVVMDRRLIDDPSNVATMYNTYKDNFGFATVVMDSVDVSGNDVTVPVTITPAIDLENAKLALVVTESNLQGPDGTADTSWAQRNFYAGGQQGPMGGYESQSGYVFGLLYHFVARSITPSATGDASGLPATMSSGTDYTATLTTTLDPSWDKNNLQYIVLLLDDNNHILNSDFSALPTLIPSLSTVAITDVKAGIEEANLYPNPATDHAYLTLTAKEAVQATMTITDIMGRTVTAPVARSLQAGQNTITIATNHLATGTYLVNLNTGKGNLVFKLQVVK